LHSSAPRIEFIEHDIGAMSAASGPVVAYDSEGPADGTNTILEAEHGANGSSAFRFPSGAAHSPGPPLIRRTAVTEDERQKVETLISRLEILVGEIFPRDGANAALIADMIQALNGLRSMLGLVRPH
jgi:hypothetical protein